VPSSLNVGSTTAASATATSGLAVTFTSSTPTICSVSGGTVTGLLAGTCTVAANQAGNTNYAAAPQITQNITVGAGPVITFNLASLSFSDQLVGSTSASQDLVLNNTGSATLTISSIVVTTNPADFVVTGCAGDLAAGAACHLSIRFTPTAAGTRMGAVKVTGNAMNSPQSVSLSGTGVAASVPVCTLTAAPASIRKNGTSTLTATCSPAATSYIWTGGTCAGSTTSTCTVTLAVTTQYSVTGTNGAGTGNAASATVTIATGDITPILFLLLFD
jgi:hypothetical protein